MKHLRALMAPVYEFVVGDDPLLAALVAITPTSHALNRACAAAGAPSVHVEHDGSSAVGVA